MTEQATIHFPLDQGLDQKGAELIYRPYGTRTLKLNVTTTDKIEDLPALRLRPLRFDDHEATGITAGYADQGDAFLISWGGGHDDGPCAKADDKGGHAENCVSLTAKDPASIFMNVRHLGHEPQEEATVTLEAYDPADEGQKVYARIPITLKKPPHLPAGIMRLIQTESNHWEVSAGAPAAYDPRWWPKAEVTYSPPAEAPPLSVIQDGAQLFIHWGDQDEPLAVVSDKTKPSLLKSEPDKIAPGSLEFEFFEFDPHHYALRIWFFWLNKNIGFKFTEALRHEVPDSERFDFLIRKNSGKIVLACTDLHWQEIWGQATKLPVEASVGTTLGTLIKIAKERAGKKLVGEAEHKFSYNPIGYVERLAEDLYKQEEAGKDKVVLAKGWKAHVPTLEDLQFDPLMTSSDVRLG